MSYVPYSCNKGYTIYIQIQRQILFQTKYSPDVTIEYKWNILLETKTTEGKERKWSEKENCISVGPLQSGVLLLVYVSERSIMR